MFEDLPLGRVKKRGWIEIGATRMCLLDVANGYYALMKEVQKLAPDLRPLIFYNGGKQGGASFARGALQSDLFRRDRNGFEMCVEAYSLCGFGDFDLRDIDYQAGKATITCPDAFEAWAVLQHDETSTWAVCHYTRGVLCSFMNVLKRKAFECEETRCRAKGDKECEFIIHPVGQRLGHDL
jgi:predicted hydrocarbon binding protein